jgi:hypothetical protein
MAAKNWAILECQWLFALGGKESGDLLFLLLVREILQIAALPENVYVVRDYLKRDFYSGGTMKRCP